MPEPSCKVTLEEYDAFVKQQRECLITNSDTEKPSKDMRDIDRKL